MPNALAHSQHRAEPSRFRVSSIPPLNAEQERRLARAAVAGSKSAFEQLVRAHVPLALVIAREYCRQGDALDDLVSEGLLGLVEATRRFDAERGVRLAAYAAFWIRAYVRRYTIFNRRIVRPPSSRNGRRVLAHLRSTEQRLLQQNGESPNHEAVAAALSVSSRDVEEMIGALSGRDVPLDADAGRALALSSEQTTPEALLAEREEQATREHAVKRALDSLDKRERRIMRFRYLDTQKKSLAAIGRDLGISRERVRQLEHTAQEKLRSALAAAS